ncbi:MAG: hypothetical protein M1829_001829 [Trizodia sp. TS-e1964]|nr:MAG: hypothetical protein M1829_001829 [Trizodia sp. TS-e1964]
MKTFTLRCLRPSIFGNYGLIRSKAPAAHVRLYTAIDNASQKIANSIKESRSKDVQKRMHAIGDDWAIHYPRITHQGRVMTCEEFRSLHSYLKAGERKEGDTITLYAITGIPHRTDRGELSLLATAIPNLLSPSLHQLPEELLDPETKRRNRHTELLINQQAADTLRLRSHIVQYLRNFFIQDGFYEVETPILAESASGAVARPFLTSATEFPERSLALRIAPELWLKRLILGGMDRVFEIGPSFRNEGLDTTHNPEFTTCEFYKSFADLEELITITESLLRGLAQHVQKLKETQFTSLPQLHIDFTSPFKRIDFIPTLEKAIIQPLPDLTSPSAASDLLEIFKSHSIPPPPFPTLPRLLDKLSSHFLEPASSTPTFIINPPAALSPLSKSFSHANGQLVSARVELFLHGRELINAYEEENSPFEQRRKFELQASWRDQEDGSTVEESYLQALEWGLPPTGGWGCGVDRLCMLFTGAERIGDVLSFGSLRNVVSL